MKNDFNYAIIVNMNRLKELCKEFKISQEELGKRLGISRDIITNIIQERKMLDSENIILFANLFNVSSDYFICNSNSGVYVLVEDRKYAINSDQLILFIKKNLISYEGFNRKLNVKLKDVKILDCNTQLIDIK